MDDDQLRRALRTVSEQQRRQLREAARANQAVLAKVAEGHFDLQRQAREYVRALIPEIGTLVTEVVRQWTREIAESASKWQRTMRLRLPANWRELDLDELGTVTELMAKEGWGLAWSPPAGVLRAFVAAPTTEARQTVLVRGEAAVLDDLDRLLREVSHTNLQECAAGGRQALEAYRCGLFMPAQALAASILLSVVEAVFNVGGHQFHGRYRTQDPFEETALEDLGTVCVLAAVAQAFDSFNPAIGPPATFTRPGSAHRVGAPQYSQANSLNGLILVVSLLKETDLLLEAQSADARAA